MSDTDNLIARLRTTYGYEPLRIEAADCITELQRALAERDATIAAAPHVATCGAVWKLRAEWPNCTCWKSAAPDDVNG